MCVCPPDSKIKYTVFCVYLCSCILLCIILLVILHAVVRQISMLFIDNKDSVFCISNGLFPRHHLKGTLHLSPSCSVLDATCYLRLAALRYQKHTPSFPFRHLAQNSARIGYATEGPLFIFAVSVHRLCQRPPEGLILIRLWKPYSEHRFLAPSSVQRMP